MDTYVMLIREKEGEKVSELDMFFLPFQFTVLSYIGLSIKQFYQDFERCTHVFYLSGVLMVPHRLSML